jgi:hypothetical protein
VQSVDEVAVVVELLAQSADGIALFEESSEDYVAAADG